MLSITPKTKVLDLINTYPQLEDILIDYVPAFKKLKNPVLRKTVAKIATLQQAAGIGNVKVEDLINRLRKEVGQDKVTDSSNTEYNSAQAAWFDEKLIAQELDVREMLAAGEHPVNQVIADLKGMESGKIYKLIAPFVPTPLIDKAVSVGAEYFIKPINENMFEIYFLVK